MFPELDYLRVDNRVLKLSKVKAYLLRYHERLCIKYKLRVEEKDGVLHRYYAWDSLLVEAYNLFLLQGLFR